MRLVLVFLFCFCYGCSFGQGLNNLWLLGYANSAGIPFGGTNMDFSTGVPNIYYHQRPMNLADVAANITDRNGNLLFYTNGVYVADRNDSVMPNGTGLNPGWYVDQNGDYGILVAQAALILPKPEDSTIYYIFHSTLEAQPLVGQNSEHFYLTTVNMSLRGGLGDVVSKNQTLLGGNLQMGKISATKHANGRDWWVMCHGFNNNNYYRFLVTPDSIIGPYIQAIGVNYPAGEGQAMFSPDGSRYALYAPNYGVEIFDFDRCSGMLIDPIWVPIVENIGDGGLAFTPNSDVLYVPSNDNVYQLNLESGSSAAVIASKLTIATWDGFFDPIGPPFRTGFFHAELALDGKIYISTGNSTLFLHEIHNPNNVGLTCNLTQHSIQLPTYNGNSFPNHPNYFLGPLVGSSCDTLTNSVAEQVTQVAVQLYPNPNNGEFSLSFAPQQEQGQLLIYDVFGKLVHQEPVAEWSQLKRVSLPNLPQGVYHSRLVWKGKTGVARFVKQE